MERHHRHSEKRAERHSEDVRRKKPQAGKFVLPLAMLVAGILVGYFISAGASASITKEQASEKALGYINSVLRGQAAAKMVSINESNGLYSFDIDIGGRIMNSFITKDGKLLFPPGAGINLEQQAARPAETGSGAEIPKSDKPKVELFVMSFCPYGVQAEGFMKPVAGLLGSKIDLKVRFIAQAGSDINSIQSLHGATEAKEDLRQICIMKNYPDKYWNYLSTFNNNCYPVYKNATALDSCWKSSAASAGIDSAKIESCLNADALALIKSDEQAAGAYGVSGSPTVIINGATYNGARSFDGFKSAICSAFNNPPAECGESVSSASQPVNEAPHEGCG